MQIVIKIQEGDFEKIKNTSFVEDAETMFYQSPEDRKDTMMLFRILDAIKDCTPLQEDGKQSAKTGWIPCSERMPEEDGCYLVTTTGTNNDIIDIAHYTEGIWHKASRIKAWMPLPEPYGGEKE